MTLWMTRMLKPLASGLHLTSLTCASHAPPFPGADSSLHHLLFLILHPCHPSCRYMIIQPLPAEAIAALYPGRKYLFGAPALAMQPVFLCPNIAGAMLCMVRLQ